MREAALKEGLLRSLTLGPDRSVRLVVEEHHFCFAV